MGKELFDKLSNIDSEASASWIYIDFMCNSKKPAIGCFMGDIECRSNYIQELIRENTPMRNFSVSSFPANYCGDETNFPGNLVGIGDDFFDAVFNADVDVTKAFKQDEPAINWTYIIITLIAVLLIIGLSIYFF